ncbi:hypothetical protein DFH27DRAFT_374306 [Peziza echinospora]|nr:hypothetical protein DFH27DRAFT_374306 [Peziza echinospora]
MNRLHDDIQRVNGSDTQALHSQRMKEWEEYYRQVANMERIARQNQPPSPQYSPTTATAGFVPITPWTTASPTQGGYPQAVYQPTYSQPTYPPQAGYSQRSYPQPGGAPPPGRYGPPLSTQTGFFPGYPSPPISNSSNNSPQAIRPGPNSWYYPAPPVRPTTPSRPTTPRPIDDEPYIRPVSRSSSRSRRPSGEREDYGRNGDRRQSNNLDYENNDQGYGRYDNEAGRGRSRRNSVGRTGGPTNDSYYQAEARPKSQCFGRNIDAGNLSHVSEVEVMTLDFEPDMTVYLYRNEETHASRIVCGNNMSGWISDHRGGGGTYQGSIKVTALTVRRESTLILNLNRNSKLWARLVFCDFENMVIFFHMFMALRSYCPTPPNDSPITISSGQRWFTGESPIWSALIDYDEDNYRLYLLQDEATRAVRIAAITEGTKHNNLTIWTAFLQSHLTKPHNGLAQESCTIILFGVSVYYFSLSFRPKSIKEFELRFLNSQDATNFREEIEELSRHVAY